MIFYKKPKIYKNGNVRHGVVIIDGVQYNVEYIENRLLSAESQLRQAPVTFRIDDLPLNFDEEIKIRGFIIITSNVYDRLALKLTKIE